MKKSIAVLIALFLMNPIFADVDPNAAKPEPQTFSAQQDESEAVYLSSQFNLVPKKEVEEDTHIPYAIDAAYPQIAGETLSPNAEKFNQIILAKIQQEIDQFKKYVKADMVHMQTLPEDLKHNTLHIDYDIDVIKPGDQALISVRLSIEGFQAGRAHPYHTKAVLNFDLGNGKLLTLDELFKPRAKYLKIFSAYANKILNKKLTDKWMIAEGTKPLAKNFKNWNLESDSIVVTFDEYQVAPYVYGSPEIEIPYSVLKTMISSNAPIYSCVVNPVSCSASKK